VPIEPVDPSIEIVFILTSWCRWEIGMPQSRKC